MDTPGRIGGGKLARLAWYRRRLAAMSAKEVAHRIGEQLKRRVSRAWTPMPKISDGLLPVIPGLRQAVIGAGSGDVPLSAWAQAADDLMAGRFAALGHAWPVAAAHDKRRWHLCPASGRTWPASDYCFSIPYRHAEGFGDVKLVWELNRLQNLQAAAAHAARTGDEAVAQRCREEIESWILGNPPFQGVNWASGIELALRVVSLMVVISLLGPDRFPEAERIAIRRLLVRHGWWLARFPSRHSSANNHLVAEAGALYLLGLLAPDLAGAAAWHRYGRSVLIRELHAQILPDGVGAEQSPTYAAFSLEWWLLAASVGSAAGEPFPRSCIERMEHAAEFLAWILDGTDGYPHIGDDDEGRVLAPAGPPETYVPAVLESLATFTGRGDLLPARSYPQLWRMLLPPRPERRERPTGCRTFVHGGYSVVRTGGQASRLIVFDHGPLGYLSIAAHGHADSLAVWVHVDGQPVLVDAGTYLYHAGGAWRDHFRGTRAHNTLTLCGADSSVISGAFNWSVKARSRLLDARDDPDGRQFVAEHDGYRERFGVLHRRTLRWRSEAEVEIEDLLVGNAGARDVEIGFLVHPDLDLVTSADGVQIVSATGRAILGLSHAGPLSSHIECGTEPPAGGWYSPAFGRREATSRVVFSGQIAPGDATIVRMLFPDR